MSWTAERHAEHKRTLDMLTRCAGNADGAKGRPGTGEARRTMVVPYRSRSFEHEIVGWLNPWPGLVTTAVSVSTTRCYTLAPARSCSCGAFALEWR